MQWPIEDRLWKVGRVKKVKGIDHKAFARFIPKDWPSRDFFVSSIFFLSLVIFTAQEEKKKRFSCSLVTRQHMRARASVFVARWQAAVEPVGSISLLVEDSTVVVLCFAAKRKKNLTWHWASWSWKGMTSRWPSSKKRKILSDGFLPPSLTSRKSRFRVSSVCPSGAASRWNCFATGGNLSYRRSSNHHGISVLRCLLFRVNGHPSFHPEFGIPSRSFVDCFFRWILLSLLISSRITLHWLFWKKLIKMNGVWMVSRNRFSNAGIIYIESDRSWLLINRLEMKMGIVSTMNDFFHSWNYDLNIANTNSYSSNTKIV